MIKTNNDSLTISIGAISVIIHSDTDFIAQIRDIYKNFITEAENPSVSIRVKLIPYHQFGEGYYSNTESPDVNVNKQTGICTVLWQNLKGEFNLIERKGKLKCTNYVNLSNFLRIIYSLILLEESGFLIHASSLIKSRKGYLFPGKSGAGKTTITRISPDAILLTDEVSLVKQVDGEYKLFGTPFWGELAISGENIFTNVDTIYYPKKDKKNFLKDLSHIESLKMLLPNVLSYTNDEKFSEELLDICHDFISKTPAYELHFLPDPSFWRLIDDK